MKVDMILKAVLSGEELDLKDQTLLGALMYADLKKISESSSFLYFSELQKKTVLLTTCLGFIAGAIDTIVVINKGRPEFGDESYSVFADAMEGAGSLSRIMDELSKEGAMS